MVLILRMWLDKEESRIQRYVLHHGLKPRKDFLKDGCIGVGDGVEGREEIGI